MRGALEPLLLDYRRHLLAAGRGTGTVEQRVNHMIGLQRNHPDLLSVTLEELEIELANRRRSHQAESRRSMRSSWMSFYGWAYKSGRVASNPAEDLLPIYVPQKPGRRAPDDIIERGLVLATLPEKAMILLGRMAGLRISEITRLHTRDREGDMLRILGKGERTRMVPVNDELLLVLQRLETQVGDGYYFPGRYGGHAHVQSISKIINRRVGVNPHSLRHAFATAAYRGTGDLRAVQVALGHASLQTTQRYIHVDVDQVRAAAAAAMFGRPENMRGSAIERVPYQGGRDG